MIEIVHAIAIIGALVSVISGLFALKQTEKRLEALKALNNELLFYINNNNNDLIKELKISLLKDGVYPEVNYHLKKYEQLLTEIIESMPEDKKDQIYPGIKQKSDKGRAMYISKILSKAISTAF